MTKPYIEFDVTYESNSIKQSVCRMLNNATQYEEKSVDLYTNIHAQMFMADLDRKIIDEFVGMFPDKNRRDKLIDIAKKVGCKIYYE